MPSILNASVPIMLDKERRLLYGAAAFIEYKDHTGKDLLRAFANLSKEFQLARDGAGNANPDFELPIKDFRDILWAGLVHDDEDLLPKTVSNMFTIGMMSELIPLVLEAFTLGLGQQKDGAERPRLAPAKKQKSTGANSGALHALTSESHGVSSES